MNKSFILRISFVLVSFVLMVFTLIPNLPSNAQNKVPDEKECQPIQNGWTVTDGSEVDLSGDWIGYQSTNCKPGGWQYAGFKVKVTKEGGKYYGQINKEVKGEIKISAYAITFNRDLTGGAGKDKDGSNSQTWTGTLKQNESGKLRIYGQWSGAYAYNKKEGFNMDFMMTK